MSISLETDAGLIIKKHRPQINIKKLYCKEKWVKQAKNPAAGEFFLQSHSNLQVFEIAF